MEPCPGNEVLAAIVNAAKTRYEIAAHGLESVPPDELELEQHRVETARLSYESACVALDSHTKQHGC